MDSKHLHAILQEIRSHLQCKQCSAKLDINDVKILSQRKSTARFEVKCNQCLSIMQISAEMKKESRSAKNKPDIQPKEDKNYDNIITKTITNHKVTDRIITNDEVQEVS